MISHRSEVGGLAGSGQRRDIDLIRSAKIWPPWIPPSAKSNVSLGVVGIERKAENEAALRTLPNRVDGAVDLLALPPSADVEPVHRMIGGRKYVLAARSSGRMSSWCRVGYARLGAASAYFPTRHRLCRDGVRYADACRAAPAAAWISESVKSLASSRADHADSSPRRGAFSLRTTFPETGWSTVNGSPPRPS